MFRIGMVNAKDDHKYLTIKKMEDGDVLINLEKFPNEGKHEELGHILKAEDIAAAVEELLKEV